MTAAPETDPDELIGRCYTRARRSPVMVGLVKTGFGKPIRLPFGPYTITQLAAIVVSAVVLVTTRPVWGGHGFLDALVLIVIPFGAAFTLRYVHIDGRNPAAALASVAVMLCGPRWGRTQGRTYRPARPRYCTTTTTLAASPLPAGAGAQQEPPAPSTHAA
ncbi:conjugal transfer protein, partial [Streptomyces sp. 8L]|uniref:conjugal transfer protein n=1 Tax=Streptomyces sp. 8L TaxID=2877242 RepID=UPI001CD197BA